MLLRIILLIPQYIVLYFLAIAVFVVAIIGWFGALFTKRLPMFAEEFISGWLRWNTRVYAYSFLLTDEYPPFSLADEPQYPVQVAIPPPTELNRLAVFFRYFLAIPAFILAALLGWVFTLLLVFVAWIVTLVTGELPRFYQDVFSAVIRYGARVYGYFYMLTPVYPAAPLGDKPPPRYPGWELEPVPAARTGLITLIVLNAIGLVAYVAIITAVTGSNTVQSFSSNVQLQAAYVSLSASVATFDSSTAACAGNADPVQCVNAADAQAGIAFSSFQSSMNSISFPSNAQAQATALTNDAGTISNDLHTLAGASSYSEYQQLVQSTGLDAKLQQFDQDYRQLVARL